MGADQRAFSRYTVDRRVELYWDGSVIPAILVDVSVGGAALEVDAAGVQQGFLLVAEPDVDDCRPLYMTVVGVHRRETSRCVVRARFDQLDRDDAAYLGRFINTWAEEQERVRLLARLAGQRPA